MRSDPIGRDEQVGQKPSVPRTTLIQYLAEQRRTHPHPTCEFDELVMQVAEACKTISRRIAHGGLEVPSVEEGREGTEGLRGFADETFVRMTESTGLLYAFASGDMAEPRVISDPARGGRYMLLFDALDGSANVDINVSVGSIFSILCAPDPDAEPTIEDFLQPGNRQVAAGYAVYGPSTVLMLTVGTGVAGFTLDPQSGEFYLTHGDVRIAESTAEFAIYASNSRYWDLPVKRYFDELMTGHAGTRGKDFNMRWISSALVAETHRILMRGGVFLFPPEGFHASSNGRLRLLHECNPIGMLVEQAGGRASDLQGPVLEVEPDSLHDRVGFAFGSREEVERLELYHRLFSAQEPGSAYGTYFSVDYEPDVPSEEPLFNPRGLFRD